MIAVIGLLFLLLLGAVYLAFIAGLCRCASLTIPDEEVEPHLHHHDSIIGNAVSDHYVGIECSCGDVLIFERTW